MSGNVYAFIPLYHDEYYITLAYPCMFVFVFCYVFSLAMITFWWEQMRGRFVMDLGDAAVRPRLPCLEVLGIVSGSGGPLYQLPMATPFAKLLDSVSFLLVMAWLYVQVFL